MRMTSYKRKCNSLAAEILEAGEMSSSHRGIPAGPVAEWTIREQLILASAVQSSGDQNWVSVSRAIKPLVEDVRPTDYFSQKNCALQYSAMLDKTGTPKRKRSSEGGTEVVETVEQQIVRQLAEKRIIELNKSLESIKEEHSSLSKEIEMLENGELDSKLPAMWEEIQAELSSTQTTGKVDGSRSVTPENHESVKLKKAILPIQHAPSAKANRMPSASKGQVETQSIKRSSEDDTKNPADVTISPTLQKSDVELVTKASLIGIVSVDRKPSQSVTTTFAEVKTPSSKAMTTSKEDTVSNRPMHAPHPSTQSTLQQLSSDVHLIVQQPNTAITRSSKEDAEKPPARVVSNLPVNFPSSQVAVGPSFCYNSKSPANSTSASTLATAEVTPSIVQQRSMPSVSQHATNSAVSAAVLPSPKGIPVPFVKLNQIHTCMPAGDSLKRSTPVVVTTQPATVSTSITSTTLSSLPEASSIPQPKTNVEAASTSSTSTTENPMQAIVHPVVEKIPVPITKAVVTTKDEANEGLIKTAEKKSVENVTCTAESGATEPPQNTSPLKHEESQPQEVMAKAEVSDTESESKVTVVPPQTIAVEAPSSNIVEMKEVDKPKAVIVKENSLPIQPGSSNPDSTSIEKTVSPTVSSAGNELETVPQSGKEIENVSTTSGDMDVQPVICETPPKEATATALEPELALPKSVSPSTEPSSQSHELKTGEEEVEVEEEATIKSHKRSVRVLRKPLSRKRRLIDDEGPSVESTDTEEEPFSTRTSAAPSPAPSQSDMDPETIQARKQWRKAIMLVWRHAAQHKYANLFLHPVREEDAPGYRDVILRPMDLYTIKRKVESGVIKTDIEFQRDMLLIFQNAFMYNSSDHDVFFMAQEMKSDVMESIQDYLATQAQLQLMENHHTPQQKTLRSREGRTREFHDESIFSPAKKRKTRADD